MDGRASSRLLGALLGIGCAVGLAIGCSQTDGTGLNAPDDAGWPLPTDSGPPRQSPPGDADAPPVAAPPAPVVPPGDSEPVAMPFDVRELLSRRCSGCHDYGVDDPAGWGSVLDLSRMIDAGIVVPGDPDGSRMIERVAVRADMPPEGERLTPVEIEALASFITALNRPLRAPLSDADVLDAISMDQIRLRNRASDYRYLSLAHLRAGGRPEEELEAIRLALSFVVNSLSRKGKSIELTAIDEQRSILRLRLADLGWDEALWDTLTSFYPYCLRSDASSHEGLYQQLATEAPVVRADWFVATATRSPLYERLLDLPATLDELGQRLGLDINRDINHPGLTEPDNLVRVGFRGSAVARHNRMVERHLGGQGQYLWVTYDFDSNEGRADLLANPLGPRTRDQRNFTHTFEHTGGEVLFTLPNGLQGYMVLDAAGNRIARAPAELARDRRRPDGVVENGVSCLGCHGTAGVLRPAATDELPRFVDMHAAGYLKEELDEIAVSYPRVLRPDVFTLDSARYRASIRSVLADSSDDGPDPDEDGDSGGSGSGSGGGGGLGEGGEYLTLVQLVGQYEANLGLRVAALELGETPVTLDDRLRAAGVAAPELPRTLATPLLPRSKLICLYRELAPKLHPTTPFCAKTFDAPEVAGLCAE
jgi:mono/diheme cytochrome c family protein